MMNKKVLKNFLILEAVLVTALTGCTKVNNMTQVSDVNESAETSEQIYNDTDRLNGLTSGFGWSDNVALSSDDNGIVKDKIILSTSEPNVDMGVICFVDGYLQPVSINGEKEQTVNIINTDEEDMYDIALGVISSRADEKIRVDIMSLLNPTYEITENTVDEGLSFRTSSLVAQTFDAVKDVEMNDYVLMDNKQDMSEEFKSKNGISDDNNPFSSKAYFRFEREDEDSKWIQSEDNKINIKIDIMGGEYNKYNVYFFVDNKVVKAFDGHDCAKVTVEDGKLSVVDVTADISDMDIGKYSIVYAIAVADGEYKDSIISPIISDKLFLKK